MFEINMEGLDELQENLDDLERRAEEVEGDHEVRLDELLDENFMNNYTNYVTFDEMIDESEFEFETEEEFEGVLETDEWNVFIENNSVFNSWDDMVKKAGAEWTAKNLGL
ncbi:hypothetical protein SAMN04488598_13824 [Halanaerobium congolense]|uniref:Uncharacterized protein n=1 Tax=Halanaerobium congolense TaxID=54121 RepID=A0A1I0CK37_9FIRM|nr:hypothetical protein [Halanaerobium congolense]PTX14855.1 hypothetical protein C7953_2921 [Halanaerobium congolense]SDG02180.1 hypothetical protein SAMN04488598_13824 [Halanaerobium congolense]SET19992.1 hypothetical protein SAMN04515652_13824 [Halanaerobium congolense]SFP66755.1 hypothetical protein SAMN04488596_1382 [Halanaerobium congolense]